MSDTLQKILHEVSEADALLLGIHAQHSQERIYQARSCLRKIVLAVVEARTESKPDLSMPEWQRQMWADARCEDAEVLDVRPELQKGA